jgi:hypothetical protein
MSLVPTHPPAFRTFQVVPIAVDDDSKACFSNDPETIAIFLWSRTLSEYQLYVNGREYGWGGITELREIGIHLRYCQDMDEVLYEVSDDK